MIKSAYYGVDEKYIDVKDRILSDIQDKKCIKVSNAHFGKDPAVNVLKRLRIETEDGEVFIFNENSICHFYFLDKSILKKTRLGIFYTNNKIKEEILDSSLASIQKSVEASNNAEVIVCPQISDRQKYFFEIDSIFKNNHHPNIVSQILQCLSVLNNYNNFKYVSFLEHDVLYPEDYFAFEDFDESYVCNQNYIGISKMGFQKSNSAALPLHQMTMKADFAKSYFEKLLIKYLYGQFETLEPAGNIKNIFNKNPSMHVNHGKNFTSHFQTYKKEYADKNQYWGECSKYQNFFL